MSELRWNPLLRTWNMFAIDRQKRPQMPKDWCPFCPGSGRVPDDYDALKYDNDFPVLSPSPAKVEALDSYIYQREEAQGKCEVILYSPEHRKSLYQLPVEHIRKLIDLWIERIDEISKDRKVQYIFPFENRGEEVGVTMPHPHGQIYGYPFVPLKIKTELDSCREYFEKRNKCLICEMNEEEAEEKKRIVFENSDFIAYIPYFSEYPYGVFIVSKLHKACLNDLDDKEKSSLAQALKVVTGSFDMIFDRPFPYMMAVHQTPVNSRDYKDSENYYHFHIEFYTPLFARDRIKYNASSETGAWASANIVSVTETARQTRTAKLKFLSKGYKTLLRKELIREFTALYGGKEGDVFVFTAPARVNLIGEHIDYNGGLVLPADLDMYMTMAVRKRKDGKVIFRDLNFPETAEANIFEPIVKNKEIQWVNYPIGVLKILTEKGYRIEAGFEVLFFSEIPGGAGMSSSAAFELVFAYGLSEIFQLGISKKNLAVICQKVENEFVGVDCGIMDQFSIALGEKDKAMLLNCETLDYRYIPLALGDYKMVLTNTNKPHKLVNSKYNERQAECKEGLADIKKVMDIENLCRLDSEQFKKVKDSITSPAVRKRVRHVVTENERVKEAAEALEKGDLKAFGKLMEKSHSSLRDDFEVTGIELDTLFEKARKFNGCIGTRMTGGGFGGCTISLVHGDKIDEFKDVVSKGYIEERGVAPSFYICESIEGVKRVD
ncbi:MAG: galactokinase [Brevinematales bacterium]